MEYKITFKNSPSQIKLNKLKKYGEISLLRNKQYKINLYTNIDPNIFITIHSRNGVIITQY